jgi:uncharacterized cupredoxin-like copper-binding protein
MRRSLLALVLLLSACAEARDEVGSLQPSGYMSDAQALIERTDWNLAETVAVDVSDYAFTPNDLVFHRGRAARLVLKNATEREHSFVAPGFFKAIAVQRIDGATTGPYLEKIVLPPGATKEIWFVPGGFGAWNFECSRTGHAMLGMKGVVAVR